MIPPKPGEVYWVDLGIAGKIRPLIIVSREDPDAERALAVCIPLTTTIRGGKYEVPIPRVRWLPGSDPGVGNVLGIDSIEYHRFTRKAGRFDAATLSAVRLAIGWMLEI
jgi:mRNA interferase MazF